MASNLGGGQNGQFTLTMTSKEYRAQTGFAFLPPHKPGNYTHSMGNAQEKVLGTEKLQQNQALFRKYTAVDRAFKKQIVAAVEPVFLSPLVDQLTGFVQVSSLTMTQQLFYSYWEIGEIDPEEYAVKMMGT